MENGTSQCEEDPGKRKSWESAEQLITRGGNKTRIYDNKHDVISICQQQVACTNGATPVRDGMHEMIK